MPRGLSPPSLRALVVALTLAFPAIGYAQEDAPPTEPEIAEAAPAEQPAAETAAAPAPSAEAPAPADAPKADDTAALLEEAAATKRAYDAYRAAAEPSAKKLAFFALLLAGTNAGLSAFKLGVGLSGRGKKILPWVALGAGVATGLLAKLAAGEPTVWALVYGLGPPLAVLAQELFGLVKSKDHATA
jgi:hypothetical protein